MWVFWIWMQREVIEDSVERKSDPGEWVRSAQVKRLPNTQN